MTKQKYKFVSMISSVIEVSVSKARKELRINKYNIQIKDIFNFFQVSYTGLIYANLYSC